MCHVRGVSNFADGDRHEQSMPEHKDSAVCELMTDCSGAASRYEGEFLDNQKDGLGVYFWRDGT